MDRNNGGISGPSFVLVEQLANLYPNLRAHDELMAERPYRECPRILLGRRSETLHADLQGRNVIRGARELGKEYVLGRYGHPSVFLYIRELLEGEI